MEEPMPNACAARSACVNELGSEREKASECEAQSFQTLSLTEDENPQTWKATKKCMDPIDGPIHH